MPSLPRQQLSFLLEMNLPDPKAVSANEAFPKVSLGPGHPVYSISERLDSSTDTGGRVVNTLEAESFDAEQIS